MKQNTVYVGNMVRRCVLYTGIVVCLFQVWDLASGKLKLSLTGHISTVRGLVVSPRQPYLFSCGEDKQVCTTSSFPVLYTFLFVSIWCECVATYSGRLAVARVPA